MVPEVNDPNNPNLDPNPNSSPAPQEPVGNPQSGSEPAPAPTNPPEPGPVGGDLEKENQILRERLDALYAQKGQANVPNQPMPTPTPQPVAPSELPTFVPDSTEFLDDPKQLNDVLTKVYLKALETARSEFATHSEDTLRNIPQIVQNNVHTALKLKETTDKFYTDNQDLKPFKRVVSATFERLASEQPGKSYDELLPSVAIEARRALELYRGASTTPTPPGSPRLPNRGPSPTPRGAQPAPNLSAVENEINEMNKALSY